MFKPLRKRRRSMPRLLLSIILGGSLLLPGARSISIPVLAQEEIIKEDARTAPQNLFEKDHAENWTCSWIRNGSRERDEWAYSNIFVSHPVSVTKGDTITWGPFHHTDVLGAVYDANGNWIRDIQFTDTEQSNTGDRAMGEWQYTFITYNYSYTVQDDDVAYVRLHGNASTKDRFAIYKNLEGGLQNFPGSIDAASTNYFDANSADTWPASTIDESGNRKEGEAYSALTVSNPIAIRKGDQVTWTPVLLESTLGALYDENGGFIRLLTQMDVTSRQTGRKLPGTAKALAREASSSMEIRDESAAYLRIITRSDAAEKTGVFLNLPDSLDDLPRLFAPQVNQMEYRTHRTIPYRLYVPEEARDKSSKSAPVPLLLFLHGAGERGSDNARHMRVALQPFFDCQPELSRAIVIAPHLNEERRWVETNWSEGNYNADQADHSALNEVMEILDEIQDEYPVDPDRIYVAGESMGGFGTWNMLMTHPDVFAAGIPMCGGADVAKAPLLKDMPIWTFHGDSDSGVPYSGTVNMVAALRNAGSRRVRFNTFQGYDHEIWDEALSTPGLGAWLFSQRLSERTGSVSLFDPASPDCWIDSALEYGEKIEKAGFLVSHAIPVRENDVIEWSANTMAESAAELFDENGAFLQRLDPGISNDSTAGSAARSVRIHQPKAASVRITARAEGLQVWRNRQAQAIDSPRDVLTDQYVLYAGDGFTYGMKDEVRQDGWAGRIGLSCSMNWTNKARSNASLSRISKKSRISAQLEDRPCQMVILSGGSADAKAGVPAGTITSGKDGFSEMTFAGGLESLFALAKEKYPDAAIGYVFSDLADDGSRVNMDAYKDVVHDACAKWGISCLDLVDGSTMQEGKTIRYAELLGTDESLQVNGDMYERIAPHIAAWMRSVRNDRPQSPVDERDTSVDMSRLETLCSWSAKQDPSAYKSSGFVRYENALTHGRSVLDYPLNQAQVDEAADLLHQRILDLRLLPQADLIDRPN